MPKSEDEAEKVSILWNGFWAEIHGYNLSGQKTSFKILAFAAFLSTQPMY
jgi:hypothetical protein